MCTEKTRLRPDPILLWSYQGVCRSSSTIFILILIVLVINIMIVCITTIYNIQIMFIYFMAYSRRWKRLSTRLGFYSWRERLLRWILFPPKIWNIEILAAFIIAVQETYCHFDILKEHLCFCEDFSNRTDRTWIRLFLGLVSPDVWLWECRSEVLAASHNSISIIFT